jgi:hypothetical protein
MLDIHSQIYNQISNSLMDLKMKWAEIVALKY